MKISADKDQKFIENFFIKKGLDLLVTENKKKRFASDKTYIPRLSDLYNLYQYVFINKRTTILEFGSGWSSVVFNLVLSELAKKFFNEVKKLRRE